jgi:hypothetical protein
MKLRFGLALLLFSLGVFLPPVKAFQACVGDDSCISVSVCNDGSSPTGMCCFSGDIGTCVFTCPGQLPPECNNN